MYDKGKIITGLVIFFVLFASPFLFNAGRSAPIPKPELTTKAKEAKQCVESKAFITAYHMQLLDKWRDEAIRQGNRMYVATTGKHYVVSLQNTCLQCHSNADKFCDQCHNYMGVTPYCWECHIESKEKK